MTKKNKNLIILNTCHLNLSFSIISLVNFVSCRSQQGYLDKAMQISDQDQIKGSYRLDHN